MTRKKKSASRGRGRSLSKRLMSDLFEADRLIDAGRPDAAHEILIELDRKRPNHPDILRLLVNACYDRGDLSGYEWAIYRFNQKVRNEPDAAIGLAGAYMTHGRFGLAIRAFEDFLKRWPDEPRSDEIQETAANLRSALLLEIKDWQGSESELLARAVRHDEVRFFMDHKQLKRAARIAERLLIEVPDFYSIMNNLAQIRILEGRYTQAAAISERVLESVPDNVHALANLVRARFMSGEFDAARAAIQRLKASTAPAMVRSTKIAEALSLLGDYEGVRELYAQVEEQEEIGYSREGALFLHYTAVAMACTGQEDRARQLWQAALEKYPPLKLAAANLEDLDRPVGERSGAWAFPHSYWIRSDWLLRLNKLLSKPASRRRGDGVERAARRFLEEYPDISHLIPHMLARGDPESVKFAVSLIRMAETPELIQFLKDFVLGQHGSDQLRLENAQFLSSSAHLPSDTIRMRIESEWHDVLLLSFVISDEPKDEFSDPEITALAGEAIEALQARNADRAIEILEKALLLAPDAPSLLNNQAMAYELKGQRDLAQDMMLQIHDRFPDYFFGIVGAAQLDIKDGNLPAARAKLNRLMRLTHLHTTEYAALCSAQIELFLAAKDNAGAQRWIEAWEQVDPDHPALADYRVRRIGAVPRGWQRKFLKR